MRNCALNEFIKTLRPFLNKVKYFANVAAAYLLLGTVALVSNNAHHEFYRSKMLYIILKKGFFIPCVSQLEELGIRTEGNFCNYYACISCQLKELVTV